MSSGHDQLPGLPAEPDRSRPLGGSLPAPPPPGALSPWGSGDGLRPAPAAGAVEPTAILNAFRRRWPLAVGLGLLLAGLAAGAAWVLVPPAKYTAYATLQITSYLPSVIFKLKEPQADFETYLATQIALLKSRVVLGRALLDPKVAALPTIKEQEEPFEWLSQNLSINHSQRSMIIRLSLSGTEARELPVILNAIVDAYMSGVIDTEFNERLQRLQHLEKLYGTYQDNLKTQRENLRTIARTAGGGSEETLGMRSKSAYENYGYAQRLRMQVRSEMLRLEADMKLLSDKVADLPPAPPDDGSASDRAATMLMRNDVVARNILARISGLNDAIARAERGTKKKRSDPYLRMLRDDLEKAQASLDGRRNALVAEAAARGEDPSAPGEGSPVARLAMFKEKMTRLKMFDESIAKDMDGYLEEAKKHTANAVDLKNEIANTELTTKTARQVGTEVEALKVELQAPRRVRIVDKAEEPKTKDELRKVKAAGAVAMFSFGAVVALVTFLEYRARRISSVGEVVQNLGLPLVGALPALPGKAPRGLAARRGGNEVERWRSRLVESIDATRTMLLHASRTDSIRVVMITSALKGEGKTSLSSHLATSLARAGRKTLLIDCDLRKPALHLLFDVPPEPGMCEILRGEAEASAVIHPTPAGELDVITAGRCDPLALQILAQDGARSLFDTLAKDYDFLIVDTSPVLPVADALLLGQQVDAVLFSIMHEVSCVPHVQLAYNRLSSLNVRVLGAVVNGAAGSNYGYDGYAVYGSQTSMAGA